MKVGQLQKQICTPEKSTLQHYPPFAECRYTAHSYWFRTLKVPCLLPVCLFRLHFATSGRQREDCQHCNPL